MEAEFARIRAARRSEAFSSHQQNRIPLPLENEFECFGSFLSRLDALVVVCPDCFARLTRHAGPALDAEYVVGYLERGLPVDAARAQGAMIDTQVQPGWGVIMGKSLPRGRASSMVSGTKIVGRFRPK